MAIRKPDVCSECGLKYKSRLTKCPKCNSGRTVATDRYPGRKPLRPKGKIDLAKR